MRKLIFVLTAIFLVGTVSAQTKTLTSVESDRSQFENGASASVDILERIAENQLNRQKLSFLAAPIQNRSDLETYLSSNELDSTPLGYLPKNAVKPFLDSLVFTDQGLASFRYAGVKGKLSPFEAYELLALFGAERFAAAIYDESQSVTEADRLALSVIRSDGDKDWFIEGYRCESRGTCATAIGNLCTNNC